MDEELRKSVRTLTSWLGETLRAAEGDRFFETVESVRGLAKRLRERSSAADDHALAALLKGLSRPESERLARAFTLYFQLVNLAEEQHRIERIRRYEADGGPQQPLSLDAALRSFKEKQVSPARLRDALRRLSLEPVLTAHPTESKRRTVLQQVQDLSRLWDDAQRAGAAAWEKSRRRDEILEILEILWRTKLVRDREISVEDEVRNVLYFFQQTILSAWSDFHGAFKSALADTYPGLDAPAGALHFGSWVGGDRDGHPGVTPDISRWTLARHRQLILSHYLEGIESLFSRLTAAGEAAPADAALARSLARDLKVLPDARRRLARAEPGEVHRAKLLCMSERLTRTLAGKTRGHYGAPEELRRDLKLLQKSLARGGFPRASSGAVRSFKQKVDVFGFHLARLDFRQHAQDLKRAVEEILGRWPAPAEWPGLIKARAVPPRRLTPASKKILDEFKTLAGLQAVHGPRAADHYILSMTQRAEDLWAVLFMARLAGLVQKSRGRWASRIDVVPLFETVDDLQSSQDTMESLWRDPFYKSLLASRGGRQEIMLGYSDSNKNGGYLTANFQLYWAQKNLVRVARRCGVEVRYFQGKGGTIDRGGGPAHRAILAAPDSANGFQLRITEQGEVVAYKYGHPVIARRNFEQMASAVLTAGVLSPEKSLRRHWERFEPALEELSLTAMHHYRDLVYDTPGFAAYFSQATPIDVIERIQIGSRPAFRRGERSIQDMRAIPWVFAWTQCRHLISAWYGVGGALETFVDRRGERGRELLRDMIRRWPFFAALLDNIQSSLAKADMGMARRYATLVKDADVRAAVYGRIKDEYDRSVRWVLDVCGDKELLARQPTLKESIRLRNPYVDSLNALQIAYLQKWRAGPRSEGERAEILRILLMTVNGVASGMKSTG